MPAGTIAVVADDLIWASRLVAAVERAGAAPARLTTLDALRTALAADDEAELGVEEADRRLVGVIVDLNGRRYDGADAVAAAHGAGKPVIAVAEHDDQVTRRRALDAGAQRVFSYNKMFTDGQSVVSRWLEAGAAAPSAAAARSRAGRP